jgi:hypothetical protein
VPPVEDYESTNIKMHLILMHDAGLIRCEPIKSSTSDRVISVIPFELTWAGHVLQTMRDENLWKKAKEHVLKPGASWSFEILKEWAKHELKQRLAIPE